MAVKTVHTTNTGNLQFNSYSEFIDWHRSQAVDPNDLANFNLQQDLIRNLNQTYKDNNKLLANSIEIVDGNKAVITKYWDSENSLQDYMHDAEFSRPAFNFQENLYEQYNFVMSRTVELDVNLPG